METNAWAFTGLNERRNTSLLSGQDNGRTGCRCYGPVLL